MTTEQRMRVIVAALYEQFELVVHTLSRARRGERLGCGLVFLGAFAAHGSSSHSGCNTLLKLMVLIIDFRWFGRFHRPGQELGYRR